MKGQFAPSDFVNGDVPGPFDNPINPRPKPWATPEVKAKSANAIVRFLKAGCPPTLFFESAYYGLHQHMFGHIAHYNRQGFYGTWFSTPERRAEWVQYALKGGAYGFHDSDRPELWGDVERLVVGWLKSSGVGNKLIEAGRSNTEHEERAALRALLARYPDEVNA